MFTKALLEKLKIPLTFLAGGVTLKTTELSFPDLYKAERDYYGYVTPQQDRLLTLQEELRNADKAYRQTPSEANLYRIKTARIVLAEAEGVLSRNPNRHIFYTGPASDMLLESSRQLRESTQAGQLAETEKRKVTDHDKLWSLKKTT